MECVTGKTIENKLHFDNINRRFLPEWVMEASHSNHEKRFSLRTSGLLSLDLTFIHTGSSLGITYSYVSSFDLFSGPSRTTILPFFLLAHWPIWDSFPSCTLCPTCVHHYQAPFTLPEDRGSKVLGNSILPHHCMVLQLESSLL